MMQEMKIGRCLFLFDETNGQKKHIGTVHGSLLSEANSQFIVSPFLIGLDYLFIHILSDLDDVEEEKVHNLRT